MPARRPIRSGETDVLVVRLVVLRPVAGVTLAVQDGRDALLPPTRTSSDAVEFDLQLTAATVNGAAVLRGRTAQGPPAARFVYVNAGTSAGQADSCWTRRAKVPLTGLTARLLDAVRATPGAVLRAEIEGTARDGGPACATVPLLGAGWQVVLPAP